MTTSGKRFKREQAERTARETADALARENKRQGTLAGLGVVLVSRKGLAPSVSALISR